MPDEKTILKIINLVKDAQGVDFTFYKHNTIIRRIQRRISINKLADFEKYFELLEKSETEQSILYKELLIGVTNFFRDTEAMSIVGQNVIPNIFANKNNNEQLRAWVVGCSKGEEAYSIAIMLQEYMERTGKHHDIRIFATDIDQNSIDFASAGIYPDNIAIDVSEERLQKFFTKSDNTYKINDKIRGMIVFAVHNILRDPPFSKIDLVSCRNLLIYLQPVLQKKVLSLFSFSLTPNGYLFLGSSESLGELFSYYKSFNAKWKIFQRDDSSKESPIYDLFKPAPKKLSKHFSDFEATENKTNSEEQDSTRTIQDKALSDSELYLVLFQRIIDLEHKIELTKEILTAEIEELKKRNEELKAKFNPDLRRGRDSNPR